MTNATQSGPSVQLRHPDLTYYDRLPPSARRALADAAFDWSSGAVLNRWKCGARGFQTGRDIAERVAEWDARQIDKDRKRVWGRS
jgi:Family of unknown function (DUF6525)